jgi:hypothetical protein
MELRDTISHYDDGRLGGADDDCECCSYLGSLEDKEKYDMFVRQVISYLDIIERLTPAATYTAFIKNESLHNHLMSLMTQVQNTTLALPDDYKSCYLKVDWEFLATLNEQIVHPTFGLNPETLWDIARLELPDLNRHLGVVINGCSHSA